MQRLPAELRETANRWLTRGYYELTVLAVPRVRANGSKRRSLGDPRSKRRMPNINFPEIATATLSNGMNLVVATRDSLPIIDVSIRINAPAARRAHRKLRDSRPLRCSLMDKGTKKYDLHELAAAKDEIAMSGQLQAGVMNDSAFNYRILHSPSSSESLDIAAEVLRNPTFPG